MSRGSKASRRRRWSTCATSGTASRIFIATGAVRWVMRPQSSAGLIGKTKRRALPFFSDPACRSVALSILGDLLEIQRHSPFFLTDLARESTCRDPHRGSNSVVECNLAKVDVEGSNPFSRSAKSEKNQPARANGSAGFFDLSTSYFVPSLRLDSGNNPASPAWRSLSPSGRSGRPSRAPRLRGAEWRTRS
jgi:hypothetical protein